MKRYLAILIGMMLILSTWSIAFAASVTAPALKCDGSSVDSQDIVEYDLADGTLTIKWTPQSSADHYYYKCIGLNEKPDFWDSYQGNRGTTLAEGTVTSNTTSKCKFTVSTSKMEDFDYLKIAVAAYDSAGTAYWTNFGVELFDSDKIVTNPAVKCDGSSVDHKELVSYDLADGTLTINWTPQTAADHYYYKCIGLNEAVDFGDDKQGNRGTTLAEGEVTSNTTSKCKFTLSTSKMEGYSNLKIAIAAYDSDGVSYWTNFGVQLSDSSATELAVSATSLSLGYAGGTDSVTVSGASSFSVSHPTEDEEDAGKKWLTVSKSGSSIKITARANYSASSRSEKITVTSSDGQTKTITVTQKAGYAAPTASIRIGNTAYSSGATYGPLANGGEDTLWLYVDVQNARRIHVATGTADIEAKDLTISASSSTTSHECAFAIPKGLAAGTYTFTVYVSNSDVKEDLWSQAITPITLNVTVVSADTSNHKYALLGGYIDYIPGQDYFTASKTKECTDNNSVKGGTCKSVNHNGSYQCAGFAIYVEETIYGSKGNTYLDGKTSGLLSSSNVTADTLKDLITRGGTGANVRAGTDDTGHSMIVTSISDAGFEVIHANWDNYCGISTKWFSWDSFKTWLNGKGYGIAKIRVHNPGSVSTPTTAPSDEPTTAPSIPTVNGKTSTAGVNFIKSYEGLELTKYQDAAGKWTIGYGHLIGANESIPDTITETQAVELLRKDLLGAESIVDSFVASNGVTLNQSQYDALVSMVFNCGSAPLTTSCKLRSHLLEYKNGSSIPAWMVYNAMARWHHAGGVDVKGLYNRRMNEARMFTSGNYSISSWETPSWFSNGNVGADVPDDWYSDYVINPSEQQTPAPSTPAPVVATDPVFNGYTALTVQDYDLANGSLTISWSADNASRYFVTAILLNEMPTKDDDTQAQRAVKTIKKEEQTANSLTMSVADLTGGQYLKFAVGAAAEGESTYHWSWVGFRLVEVPAACAHTACTWKTTQVASCSAEGLEEYVCDSCKTAVSSRTIAKTSHTAGGWVIITNATETSTGLKRQSCTACGATVSEETIPMVTPSNPGPSDLSSVSISASTNVNGKAGDTVTVPVSISNPNGVPLGAFEVSYSLPDGVTVKKVELCGLAADALMVNQNPIAVTTGSGGSISGTGQICEITFALDASVVLPATITVSPKVVQENGSSKIPLSTFDIVIGNPSGLLGDVNEDGFVDLIDIMQTARYVYVDNNMSINLQNADVNGDGTIDLVDIMRIARIAYPAR